jgi:hypothetical protein
MMRAKTKSAIQYPSSAPTPNEDDFGQKQCICQTRVNERSYQQEQSVFRSNLKYNFE